MYKFSERSRKALDTCDMEIQMVCEEVIKHYDFSVVEGFRDKDDQNQAWEMGMSGLKWPDSKHNQIPSLAVDLIPYPSGYEDINEFYVLATYMFKACLDLGVDINWGGHWNWKDYPHWELNYE